MGNLYQNPYNYNADYYRDRLNEWLDYQGLPNTTTQTRLIRQLQTTNQVNFTIYQPSSTGECLIRNIIYTIDNITSFRSISNKCTFNTNQLTEASNNLNQNFNTTAEDINTIYEYTVVIYVDGNNITTQRELKYCQNITCSNNIKTFKVVIKTPNSYSANNEQIMPGYKIGSPLLIVRKTESGYVYNKNGLYVKKVDNNNNTVGLYITYGNEREISFTQNQFINSSIYNIIYGIEPILISKYANTIINNETLANQDKWINLQTLNSTNLISANKTHYFYFVVISSAFGDINNPQNYIMSVKIIHVEYEKTTNTSNETILFKVKYKYITADQELEKKSKSPKYDYINPELMKY